MFRIFLKSKQLLIRLPYDPSFTSMLNGVLQGSLGVCVIVILFTSKLVRACVV